MQSSIQQFLEVGTKNLQRQIRKDLQNGKDIGSLSTSVVKELFVLGRNILSELIEDLDEELRNDSVRLKEWTIVNKQPNSLITRMGTANYDRTCFKNKKNGACAFLADELMGILPHERIASDVETALIEEAVDTSYEKGGSVAIDTEDVISKQATMNHVRKFESIPNTSETKKLTEKKKRRILYIEADEDHVALQSGGIVMPRLVYVHEGIEWENFKSNRKKLKNVHIFGGVYAKSEDLWEEVLEYVYENYYWDYIEKIYIAGDGAPWIKQGLGIISKSKFVLDRFHLKKYLKKASAHMDGMLQKRLKDAVWEANRDETKKLFSEILKKTEEETKKESVKDARKYIFNHWNGIKIYEEDGYDVIGCSAEGHVSHMFSARLSSRPKGWSVDGVDKMARLRIYRKNGGKIVDLVKKRREKELEEVKKVEVEFKKKILNRTATGYFNNTNIPILQSGVKTPIYSLLKAIRGA